MTKAIDRGMAVLLHLKDEALRFQAWVCLSCPGFGTELTKGCRPRRAHEPKSIMTVVQGAEGFIRHCRAHQCVLVALAAWDCAAFFHDQARAREGRQWQAYRSQ